MDLRFFVVFVLALWPLAGWSEEAFDQAGLDACLEARFAERSDPAGCFETAFSGCAQAAVEGPSVAALCYERARVALSEATAGEVARADAGLPGQQAAILRIEAKYDLLHRLLGCDRAEELAQIASDPEPEALRLGRARCGAEAVGFAYAKLRYQLRDAK